MREMVRHPFLADDERVQNIRVVENGESMEEREVNKPAAPKYRQMPLNN